MNWRTKMRVKHAVGYGGVIALWAYVTYQFYLAYDLVNRWAYGVPLSDKLRATYIYLSHTSNWELWFWGAVICPIVYAIWGD